MAIAATVHSMIQTSIVLQVGIVLSCVAFAFQWLRDPYPQYSRFTLPLFTFAFHSRFSYVPQTTALTTDETVASPVVALPVRGWRSSLHLIWPDQKSCIRMG